MKLSLSEQARARELYVQGISRPQIATKLGTSCSAVTNWTRTAKGIEI